jgi:hypothetical protein
VIEPEVHAARGKSDEQDAGRIPPSSATRTLPRLLDQRFDQGFELVTIDGIARSRRTRRRTDNHSCAPLTVKLL